MTNCVATAYCCGWPEEGLGAWSRFLTPRNLRVSRRLRNSPLAGAQTCSPADNNMSEAFKTRRFRAKPLMAPRSSSGHPLPIPTFRRRAGKEVHLTGKAKRPKVKE